jgi:phosphoserine phosphatase
LLVDVVVSSGSPDVVVDVVAEVVDVVVVFATCP